MGWLRRLFKRARLESDLERELRAHLEHHIADLVAQGIDRPDAERRARLEFGAVEDQRSVS